MARKITGTVDIIADEITLINRANATASGIGKSGEPPMQKNPVMSDSGNVGFVEEPVEARCELTHVDSDETLLDNVARLEEVTVIFRARSGGKSYTLNNAHSVGNFTLTAGEGETALAFIGTSWSEALQ